MKNLKELLQELEDLKIAYLRKFLTTNEYCEMYLEISKKIERLNN